MKTLKKTKLLAIMGLGKWPALREGVAAAIYHAGVLPDFRVQLLTDWPELAAPLEAYGIEVVEAPPLPETRERCRAEGLFHDGRIHYFGLKIEVVRYLAGCGLPAILIDSDAAALRPLGSVTDLPPGKHIGLVRDRWPDPVASRTKKPSLATPEEWGAMEAEGSLSHDVPTHNTGFIVIRPGRWVERFARAWLEVWREFRGVEQQALSRLVYHRPTFGAGILDLPGKFNRFAGWQMQRPDPRDPNATEAPIDLLAAAGELVVVHNHDVAVSVFKRTTAWQDAPEALYAAGAKPGMKPRT